MERRLRGQLGGADGDIGIPKHDGAAPIPLSFGQESIWFIQQMQPAGVAYNMHHVVRLQGPLDVGALVRSFHSLIRRHESLRTRFIAEEGRPRQVIVAEAPFDLPLLDLRGHDERRQEEVARLIKAEIRRPFDLAQDSLLRALLLQQADDDHILVVTVHHIIFDDWSSGIFWRELSTLYRAHVTGDTPSLPELPVQYADFAVWQREHVRAQMPAELTYWKGQLDSELAPLLLPTDHPRPPQQGFHGGMKWIAAPDDLYLRLKSLNQTFGATTFMALLACFQLLLHRYVGQGEIRVGYPIANRSRPETQGLIGLFLNTLVMRTDFADDLRFHELLARVRQAALDGYAHQNLPFERLVDELHAPRYEGYNPIFQVMFVHQRAALDEIDLPGLTATEIFVDVGVAKFDLTLFAQESERGLSIGVEYDSALFRPATIDRLLGHFLTLLASVVNDPHRRVSELDFLGEDERRMLLHTWNDTAAAAPPHACIHQLIEEQARRQPETTAVIDQAARLTYRQLDERANRLARQLVALGVRADTPVGLLLERSTDMIVAILGVLKAGGAYLPLDPAYPPERLSFMLADAGAPVLVSHRKLAPPPGAHALRVVSMDGHGAALAGESGDPSAVDHAAEHLAYIIYTSGSTGRPKGVPVTHQNLVHSTAARFHFYEQPVGRFLLLSSFTFDSSMVGIFWTLCQGGTLVLPPQRIEQDMQQLAATVAAHCITHLLALPALYALLLEQAEPSSLASLRTVIVAGEECRPGLVRDHYARLPAATLYNEYGPTEATVWSTAYKIPADFAAARVPIGRPIPNMRNYILDRYGQPAPIGVPGELCIAGAGVTAGYLNRPELTAEKFVECSLAGQPPVRLYRTGDLARYLPDGAIEYLGRLDDQVKIRGVRVELGEIEAALSRHPAVRQCAVVVHTPAGPSGAAAPRLAAYVQPHPSQAPAPAELRAFLLGTLPEAMAPSSFVLLDALPLTPNGKVDRRRLPSPEVDPSSRVDAASVAPRTPLEAALAAIWAEVLGLAAVSVHDNFFELGGDSILSIQIMAKAARQRVKLKPNDIFRAPTVAALASVATVADVEAETQQSAATGPVGLTPIQHWFFEQNLSEPHHWNQSYLLQLAPDTDPGALERSLQHLYRRHDALRLRFQPAGAGWAQEYGPPDRALRLMRVDLSGIPAEGQPQALTAAATEIQRSLDLDGGLAAAALFELGAGQAPRLLLVVHHLAVDAVSWQILLEDLETAYRQLRRGEPVQLPNRTSSFQQWAGRLTAFAQSSEVQQDMDFWRDQLAGDAWPVLPDAAAGDAQNLSGSTATCAVGLTAEETRALLQQVPTAYQTQINDALLTALLLAFAEQTGGHALAVDLEGHGREDLFEGIDLSRTVGWFTAVFPLRLHVSPGATVGEALIAVKEQLRRVPRRGLSYGLLRYLSQDAALRGQLARQPGPQLTFNYLGQFDQSLPSFALFRAAPEARGAERSPRDRRRYRLDVNGWVEQGRLVVHWSYSREALPTEVVEGLASRFVGHLRRIIDHCTAPGAGGYTPSDFPLIALSQAEVDRIAQGVARRSALGGATVHAKNVDAIYPLSPMQQLMLVHALGQPDSRVLFTQVRYTLAGTVDEAALRASWQRTVDRHPALRTGFDWENSAAPLQVVWRQARLEFALVDLRHQPPAEQPAKLARILEADRARGFDLTRPPLMRLTLVCLAAGQAELIWSSHHLVMDRWCVSTVLREMFHHYRAAVGGGKSLPLADAPPYAGYIRWLQNQDERHAETFWRARLRGFTRPTLLTSRGPARPALPQRTLTATLSPEASQRLLAAARRQRLTLNTVAQGVWALLLGQHCQTDDVVFGAAVAGRPPELPGVESMVGSFINNLPVRVAIDRAQPLSGWLQLLQAHQLAAQPYEHVALAQIQAWSEVPSQLPLFDTLLIFQASVALEPDAGATFRLADAQGDLSTIYPFALSVAEEGSQLRLWATVTPAWVDEPAARAYLEQLLQLFQAIADHMDRPVGALLATVDVRSLAPPVLLESPVLTAAAVRSGPAAPAQADVERRLIALWESVLGVSPIGVQDDFFQLGGSSLQALHLFSQIAAQFGRSLPLASLIQGATVQHLAALLQQGATDGWSVLVPIQPDGPNPPFFCIHGITGDVLWFRELGRCLAPDQPLIGIQARGLDGVSPPFDRIEPMAAYYVQQMRGLQPNGPYYLGGASLGGTVALEMAQQLRAQGEEVGLLVMFDHAPAAVDAGGSGVSLLGHANAGWRIARNFPHWLDSFLRLGAGPMVARLRRKARLATRQLTHRIGASVSSDRPADAADLLDYGAELPAFRQKMIADHFAALARYVPPPYPGRILLFQARAQPLLNTVDPMTGWQRIGAAGLECEIVDGSHEGMFMPPNVEGLARRLRDRLQAAYGRD